MALTGLAVARLHNLYAVVMLAGIYSLLAATVLLVLDGVDVALTEAAVGAGVSTLLALGTLAVTRGREKPPARPKLLPLLVVAVTGGVLIYASLDMAHFGDPNAPVQTHVGPAYIAEAPETTGMPNVVTSVLASYRGIDTLGEVVVIFAAGVGVILLLGSWRRRSDEEGEDA